MKVYIVIELGVEYPSIIGVYSTKEKAEKVAYKDGRRWRNILEKVIDETE